jgi:hypothetical protein
MMTNTPSTSGGYRSTSTIGCPTTIFGAREMRVGQIKETQPAEQLHPTDTDRRGGQHGGHGAEDKPADQAISESLLVFVFGSPSTMIAMTRALSALSGPSRPTSSPTVTGSATVMPRIEFRYLDSNRIKAYTRLISRLEAG